jgi:hypothetical protein
MSRDMGTCPGSEDMWQLRSLPRRSVETKKLAPGSRGTRDGLGDHRIGGRRLASMTNIDPVKCIVFSGTMGYMHPSVTTQLPAIM